MEKQNSHGMALVTVLLMVMILVMLTTAIVSLNANNLLFSRNYYNKTSALTVAESGVAYTIYALQDNPSWEGGTGKKYTGTTSKGKFTIDFNTGGYYSCNNLTGSGGTKTGYNGATVASGTADIIVTGEANNIIKRVRVIVSRSSIPESGRCSGTANVTAENFEITRKVTAQDPSLSGSFHSNSDSNSAIVTDNLTRVIAHGGVISAVGNIQVPTYDSNSATQLRPNIQPRTIPDIDIKSIVNNACITMSQKSGGIYKVKQDTEGGPFRLILPDNTSLTTAAEISNSLPGARIDSNGSLVFTQDICFGGNVEFQFVMKDNKYKEVGVVMEKPASGAYPSIYVKENDNSKPSFQVLGKIDGNGSIYTDGKSKFIMQTNLTADNETGMALLCEKDIEVRLPAGTSNSSVDLSIAGIVLTHSNLNASVMAPTDSDNPSVYLPEGEKWPSDWVDTSYAVAGSFPSGDTTVPSNLSIGTIVSGVSSGSISIGNLLASGGGGSYGGGGGSWSVSFGGGGSTTTSITANVTGYTQSGHTMTPTLTADGSSSFSWTGTKLHYVKITLSDGSFYTAPANTSFNQTSNSGWNYTGFSYSGSGSTSYYTKLFNAFKALTFSGSGTGSTSGSGTGTTTGSTGSAQLVAPDVSITGTLIVTDPNNLDGLKKGPSTRGNINVNLSCNGDRGDFKLIHSKNYEKLLNTPEVITKIVVNTWEELR